MTKLITKWINILSRLFKTNPTVQPTWEFEYLLNLDPEILKYQIDSYNNGTMAPRFELALEALEHFCNENSISS